VGSGEYSDPQVAAELADQQCGVPASSKRDVKADSMTPASLARGCLDPPMSAPGLAPRFKTWLGGGGQAMCPPSFHQGSGQMPIGNFESF
jgi:hypothetical protein